MIGEFAGLVTAVMRSTALRVGDRVCGWGVAPFASIARVSQNTVCRIPDWMSYTTGASIPTIFASAYHGLVSQARLLKGQTVIVHSAYGSLGQAALLIAHLIRATIVATVRDTAERDLLLESLGFPLDFVLPEEGASLRERVLSLTHGNGVHVIMNCSPTGIASEVSACLKSFGSIIHIEEACSDQKHQKGTSLPKNATLISFEFRTLIRDRPTESAKALGNVMSMLPSGKIMPENLIKVMPITDLADAFRNTAASGHIQKVVVEAKAGVSVKVICTQPP